MSTYSLAWLDALVRKIRRRGIFGVFQYDPYDTFPRRFTEAETRRVEEILARRRGQR